MKIRSDEEVKSYFVKIAHADAIERETANFKKYIDGNLFGRFHPILTGSVIFWDLGGVKYSFLDNGSNNLISFREHYDRQSDVEKIIKPLRHFYQVTWSKLYEQGTLAREKLDEYYKGVTKLSRGQRMLNLEDERIMIPGIQIPILNPVHWLDRHIYLAPGVPYHTAVTHGDLHGDNLLVDGEHAWVIDFERTGPGHILARLHRDGGGRLYPPWSRHER